MIIDCHAHLGRNEHISARVDELLKSMDEANIDKALVFAGELNALSNEEMLKEIAPHKDRLLGVADAPHDAYLPVQDESGDQEPYEKILEWYENKDIVAVKFYTGYYHYLPSDRKDLLLYLNKVGCPAIFHCGDCLNSVKCAKLKYSHPLNIDEVAVDFPNMNFIIAHVGYPWHRDAAEVCYKNSNVYADVSGFVYGKFDEKEFAKFHKVLQEFQEISSYDKLLFGTDWPISDQSSYVRSFTNDFGDAWEAEYLSENVKKAFKLP